MKKLFFVLCKRWGKRLAVTFGICLGLFIVLLGGLLVFLGTETGLTTLIDLASRLTNGQLTVQKASGSLYSKANLQGVKYTDTGLELSLEELQLDWAATQLWHRHFSIEDLHLTGLRLFMAPGEEEPAPPDSAEPFTLPAIDLPIRISLGRLLVNDFSFFSQQDAEKPDFELKEAEVRNFVFADQRLHVKQIAVENKEMLLQAQVEAQSIESWPLRLDLKYQYAMEELSLVSGEAKLDGSLPDLLLEAKLQSPAPLSLRVQVMDVLDNLRWNLHLAGDADLAKIMADLPDVQISGLLITGQGSAEEYALNLQLRAAMKELGEEALQLSSELHGNLKGVNLQSFHLVHKQANLTAQGELAWEPQLAWQTQIQANHLDPSFLLAEWPADINLNLQTSGQIQDEGLAGVQAELLLADLSGKLRGFPLQGKGKITMQEGQVHIPDFVLSCAGSSLRLQGNYAEKANLRFDLNSPDLQALVPEIKGRIMAKGQLNGRPEQLDVDLQAQADELVMTADNATSLKKLRLQAKGQLSADSFPQIHLQAEGLQSGETLVDAVELALAGSVADNQMKLEVKSNNGNVHIGLKGKADMEKMAWNGQIHDTRIELPQVGALQQKQVSALQLSASKIQLAPFCLEMKEGSFCLNASLVDDIWQAQTKVDRLDLALLKKFPDIILPPTIKQYGGIVVADLKASGQGASARQANLDLSLKDLFLVLAADGKNKEQRLQWEKNQIQLSYANNRLNASLHSNLPKKVSMDMDLQVDKVDLAQPDHLLQSPIQGKMQMNVRDFALINQLSENMVNITGILQGNVRVSNTLMAPMLNGQIQLTDGNVTVAPLGIALSPLSLQIQSNAKQEMQLQARAKSGEGEMQISTRLQMQQLNMNKATITVKGEKFQAMNLPGLAAVISPDLNIQINEKQMSIRGSVTVPSASISSTIDTSSAMGVSDDVVVIDDEKATAATASLPMYLRVKVIFGDDVRMNAYGLRGRIAGHLEVSGEPERPLLGTGTLKVEEGTFTFMSKRLGLDLSRLMFTGGPLDNPGVDLRVETNDGKVKAGLTVQGTLRRQEINFYSTPSMDQFTILKHLLENTAIAGETRDDLGAVGDVAEKVGMGGAVPYLQALKKFSMIDEIRLETGDDFDSASLVFGSWLTPDFYISYGKSLLDETSTFNTRYTIGKGFFLTTNASPTASGGDVKYELER